MKKKKGYFITFEGPEGSGKSTQIRKAAAFLRRRGRYVVVLREPGGTRVSEVIRKILLNRHLKEMTFETELFLYLAARSQIVREKILPALRKGHVVICDRFEDSTLAYQGYGRHFPLKMIRQISWWVRGVCIPDRTFLLDIPPSAGLKRGGRRDRIECQSLQFHEKVRRGYLDLARRNRRRFVVIDATRDRDVNIRIIRGRLKRDLG